MYDFDKELCKFCGAVGCNINIGETPNKRAAGVIRFDPEPSIWANNDMLLAHEICHLLAGKEEVNLFKSSVNARNCDIFTDVLNILFDEYHESLHGHHSDILYKHLCYYHSCMLNVPIDIPVLDDIYKNLIDSVPGKKMDNVKNASDLVTIADHICEEILPKQMAERNLTKSNVVGRINWRDFGWRACRNCD